MRKENWTYKKLGEVCDVINGLWTGKKEPFVNVAVIRNTNFSKDCKLKLDDVAYIDVEAKQFASRKLQCGDIIIEKSGGSEKQPVGRPVLFDIVEGDYSFSNFTSTLRIKEGERISPKFLHICLYSYYVQGVTLKMQSKTTGLHNLDMKAFLQLQIPKLSHETQSRIVSELDLLQSIIDKQKTQLKELDNLAQAIFYDMFGDPVENEKGWERRCFKEICEVTSSKRVYQSEWHTSGVPFYRISDFTRFLEGTNIVPELFITRNKYEELKLNDQVPEAGDILITSRGTLGNCYIVKDDDRFYFQDGMITWLRRMSKQITPLFIVFLFKNSSFRCQIDKNQSGSTVAYLSISMLKNFILPTPPLSLQQSFAQKIGAVERQKELINQSIREAQTLFDSRMEYYFGE
ncbi:MAG: restriction endonuclease subunit S [Bacteroidales bacterium]|nr:restriction endonuclease subunit S [Bacteroidales bacterium]